MRSLILVFIFNIMYCNWAGDIIIGDKFLDEIEINRRHEEAIKRHKSGSYSYKDFKTFKSELKGLSKWRLALVKESQAQEERNLIYKGLSSYEIKKKQFYYMRMTSADEAMFKAALEKVKKLMRELETIYNKQDSSVHSLLKAYYYNIANDFYGQYVRIISYKNKNKTKKIEMEGLDWLELKEALAKATMIFIYYAPLLYDDLEFLFSETGENFFN